TVVIKGSNASPKSNTNSSSSVAKQQSTVTGKVTDDQGAPLSGVTVTVKGTNVGTSTDNDGNYSLSLPAAAQVLVFSAMGYNSQELPINGQATVDATLVGQVDNLDEVVVVGYSTQRVRYLSSSVSTISADKVNVVTANDLPGMLQGNAPGVVVSTASGDPSSPPRVLIRGAGTISANTSPLTVVDGNIGGTYNPADIESVSILKDVAATGLYGSRAANGVIIINTKTGKPGQTKVEFNNSFGMGKATTGSFRLMNSQELYDFQNTFYNRDAKLLENNTNWWDLAFRTSYVNSHNLSISGGSE